MSLQLVRKLKKVWIHFVLHNQNLVAKTHLFVGYIKVFSHDTSGGLFSNKDQVLKSNPENSDAYLYSIFYRLEEFRNSEGNFQFKLCYPEIKGIGGKSCNEWIQSSNPATDSDITGFKPISMAFVKNSINQEWKGLGINLAGIQGYSLIDDAPSHGFWFSAIGAFRYWGGKNTIPTNYSPFSSFLHKFTTSDNCDPLSFLFR